MSLPHGLSARRPLPADARAVLALVTACDIAAVGVSDSTLTQVESDLAWPGYDRERAGWLVLDGDERAVGWLWAEDDRPGAVVFLDPYSLRPEVLEWLFAQGLRYAEGLATERGTTVKVRAGAYQHDALMTALLAGAGLEPVRHFWRMRIDLSDASPPPAAVRPPGLEVRVVSESDEDQTLLHRLEAESFRDHWSWTERPYDEWRRQHDVGRGRDPSQWWVAYVDGEPAGTLLGDESEADLGVSTVATLGVLRPYRGRGVAKALLATAFEEARRRGRDAVVLMVDSESLTGATRLYESVGMSVDKVMVSWKGEVRPRLQERPTR